MTTKRMPANRKQFFTVCDFKKISPEEISRCSWCVPKGLKSVSQTSLKPLNSEVHTISQGSYYRKL